METLALKELAGALRESEHRFRQLIENLPQLVWTCTPAGECDYLSPQWVAYTGIPESVQLNLGWTEQIHPDDRTALFTAWSLSVRTGQPFRYEMRIRRHDNQYRWFEARAVPLRNPENQIVKWFGASSDIQQARENLEALESEQKLLANLVALAPAVFCSFCLRADGGAYFPYASQGIEELYGIHPDVLKQDAAHLFALVHPADTGAMQASIAASAHSMSTWSAHFRIAHTQKGTRWIEGRAAPARQEDGSIIWHGFLSDITEQKQREADRQFLLDLGQALQAAATPEAIAQVATRLLSDYFDMDRCSLSTVDMQRRESTRLGEFARRGPPRPPNETYPLSLWADSRMLDILASGAPLASAHTPSDSLSGGHSLTHIKQSDVAMFLVIPYRREGQWVAMLGLSAAQQRAWQPREIELATAAAEKSWLAYEAARALAAERAMHATLAASEERLRLVLESAAIGTWEQDPASGEIQWDARAREIFGFADPKVARDAAISCIHPEDRDLVLKKAQTYQDPVGDGRLELQFRIHAKDNGALRYVYDLGRTFFTGEGPDRRPVRSVGTLQDITALKEGEKALRLANQELEEFAYVASHDLKAPLRVIGNAAAWLEEDLRAHLTPETREHLDLLRGRVRRMDKLLDDLLEYARIGRKTDERYHELVAGDALLHNIVQLLAPVGFRIALSPAFAGIRVARMPLQQILLNLIGNAIKHHHRKEGCIEVTVEDCGAHFAFAVKDDGPGIAPRFHEQIFQMFTTLRPRDQVEGSGMGLAMVRKNIEIYGGALALESAEGQGATFRFTWPKTPAGSPSRSQIG